LLEDGASRLKDKHDLVLFTDGEPSYASLFPEIFGVPYSRYRYGNRGRPPEVRYRIPRSLAHVQISKKRSGYKLKSIKIRYRHGTKRRAQDALFITGAEKIACSKNRRRGRRTKKVHSENACHGNRHLQPNFHRC
jgi:hypothetical protein